MDELIKQFPELIKVLLEKVSQSESNIDVPEIKEARDKLLSQLKTITDQMSGLQSNDQGQITEEQLKMFIETLPRTLPPEMQWNIKPRGS